MCLIVPKYDCAQAELGSQTQMHSRFTGGNTWESPVLFVMQKTLPQKCSFVVAVAHQVGCLTCLLTVKQRV